MPWWAGVILALTSYAVLHHLALQPVAAPAQPGQLGPFVNQALRQTLAAYGQYILPLICLAGAGVSAWRRHERRKLVTQVAEARSADVLDGMTWQQFEQLVGEGFVVTSGRFTDDAAAFAKGRNVELVDGQRLQALISKATHQGSAANDKRRFEAPPDARFRRAAPDSVSNAPDCPLCAKPMVKRTAKRGASAGTTFWGCTGYPRCRGTRPSP